jgi:hypothetical protein
VEKVIEDSKIIMNIPRYIRYGSETLFLGVTLFGGGSVWFDTFCCFSGKSSHYKYKHEDDILAQICNFSVRVSTYLTTKEMMSFDRVEIKVLRNV